MPERVRTLHSVIRLGYAIDPPDMQLLARLFRDERGRAPV